MKKTIVYILLFALAGIIPSCITSGYDDDYLKASKVKVGDKIPGFTLTDKDGKKLTSDDLKGKRSLIYFFITTCGDCHQVTPVIQGVWEKIRLDDKYQLVVVNRGESVDEVEKYFSENGITMPYYLDQLKEVYNQFAEKYVPRVYIVDSNGVIEWMTTEEKLPDDAGTAEELFGLLE